jgi:anti-anti-sigma factor
MELEIAERSDTLTRLVLRGRLDTPGVDAIEARMNAALARGGNVVVELAEVTFLSSLGIRLLISTAKLVARGKGRMVLAGPKPLVDQALRHSSIEDLIPVAPDLAGALALLET